MPVLVHFVKSKQILRDMEFLLCTHTCPWPTHRENACVDIL